MGGRNIQNPRGTLGPVFNSYFPWDLYRTLSLGSTGKHHVLLMQAKLGTVQMPVGIVGGVNSVGDILYSSVSLAPGYQNNKNWRLWSLVLKYPDDTLSRVFDIMLQNIPLDPEWCHGELSIRPKIPEIPGEGANGTDIFRNFIPKFLLYLARLS